MIECVAFHGVKQSKKHGDVFVSSFLIIFFYIRWISGSDNSYLKGVFVFRFLSLTVARSPESS